MASDRKDTPKAPEPRKPGDDIDRLRAELDRLRPAMQD